MPRKPPIKNRTPSQKPSIHNQDAGLSRRTWLTRWKEQALQTFPYRSSAVPRANLREAVELALVSFGPEDSEQEVADVVARVVQNLNYQIEAELTNQALEDQKRTLIQWGQLFLEAALNRYPKDLVGVAQSPQQLEILARLRPTLRATLESLLTGKESLAEVKQQVTEWVNLQLQQDPTLKRKGMINTAKKLLAPGAVIAAGLALQNQKVQHTLASLGSWIGPILEAYEEQKTAPHQSQTSSSDDTSSTNTEGP